MVSALQARRARTVAASDANHAESIKIEPRVSGGQYAVSSTDGGRDVLEIMSVLKRTNSENTDMNFPRTRDKIEIGTGSNVLLIRREVLPDISSIKKGDIVTATDRFGQPKFEITHIDNRATARIIVTLSAIRG